jgi:pimeloyl-ACP methyl ester carboxylesterase
MATDVLTVVDGSGIGVGHSMGGAALVMAEVTRPGTFSALVLAEPILLAPPVRRGSYPLAEVVRKRRRVFGSRAAARENFVSKLPFSRWGSAALDGYVAGGLVDAANGVVLGCDPDFEADVYDRSTGHGVLELVSRVSAPVVVLVGEDSDTYDVEWAGVIASAFPQGRLEVVRAGTHFIPMEQPEVVAAAVRSVVDQDAE